MDSEMHGINGNRTLIDTTDTETIAATKSSNITSINRSHVVRRQLALHNDNSDLIAPITVKLTSKSNLPTTNQHRYCQCRGDCSALPGRDSSNVHVKYQSDHYSTLAIYPLHHQHQQQKKLVQQWSINGVMLFIPLLRYMRNVGSMFVSFYRRPCRVKLYIASRDRFTQCHCAYHWAKHKITEPIPTTSTNATATTTTPTIQVFIPILFIFLCTLIRTVSALTGAEITISGSSSTTYNANYHHDHHRHHQQQQQLQQQQK